MFSPNNRLLLLLELECQAVWVKAQQGAQSPERSDYAHVEQPFGKRGYSIAHFPRPPPARFYRPGLPVAKILQHYASPMRCSGRPVFAGLWGCPKNAFPAGGLEESRGLLSSG